ncbi:RNA polymerase sigma factor [Limnoglobus roseus]|uniref:Sigma-70 family RNA polymerase sigma factor n=1 Tax=Limnoglobus roseus TaxID=2598579 RepID=A0A5C1AEW3_9BACT|nr:sigma-70 family RNA polymerase sigma factor [Limnoglobus roseus]QEL16753.1 sigma-70 family RNA polymerase sigma factor [Limnoglobus roseus]
MPDASQFGDLMRRVRNRDEAAARDLVARYEATIRRVIRIRLRDANLRRLLDSTDICQSVLTSFFVRTAMGQYDLETPEQLVGLLSTIARNKLANQANRLRAGRRDVRRDAADGEQAERVPDDATDPGEQAASRELLEKVRGGLDEQERYLADQRALGRTWQDLADEVGGTDVALRKKLARALDRVVTNLGIGDGDA